jgi:cytochrome c oxidase assembly factor CtaG
VVPLAGIVSAAALYALGGRRLAHRNLWRDGAFYAGLATLVVAVVGPVDEYADRLFFIHMTQHVLITMVAPPLLLVGRPWPRVVRALPQRMRRRVARTGHAVQRRLEWPASPLPAFALFNGVLLLWHVPALYDATLRSEAVHDCEHVLFFVTALLFWAHLVPAGRRPALGEAQRVAYGTGAIFVSWALAVVLGLATRPLYGAYAGLAHRPLGISALADQQLAAGVMWVPASIPFTVAVFVAAYGWLGAPRHLRPREI